MSQLSNEHLHLKCFNFYRHSTNQQFLTNPHRRENVERYAQPLNPIHLVELVLTDYPYHHNIV